MSDENKYSAETILENIQKACKNKNVTPSRMAEESGAGLSAIANLKRGSIPRSDKLAVMADYLGVSVNVLVGQDSIDDLKFALWGGENGVTDEMLDEVMSYARMVKMREDAKNKK